MTIRQCLLAGLITPALTIGTASAATFSVLGGTAETVSLPCDSGCSGGPGVPVGLAGWQSATAALNVTGSTYLRFEYLGSDAANRNEFSVPGVTPNPMYVTGAGGTPYPSVFESWLTPAQFSQFLYRINVVGGTAGATLGNGSSEIPSGAYAGADVFYGIPGSTASSRLREGDVLVLGLTDGGTGCRPTCALDNDHQDLGVRVSAVPEPSTYALLALGLGLFGFTARRKMKR